MRNKSERRCECVSLQMLCICMCGEEGGCVSGCKKKSVCIAEWWKSCVYVSESQRVSEKVCACVSEYDCSAGVWEVTAAVPKRTALL